MKGLNLTHTELIEVTGKLRPSAQYRVLIQMCIPVVKRPDGKPVVSREAYIQEMGVKVISKHSITDTPDFSSFRL